MYKFSVIEKHILNELVSLKGSQVMLGNLIIKKINRTLIKINPLENSATMVLHHYMGNTEKNMPLYEKVYKENMALLCTSVGLLNYLKQHNLIYNYCALSESELTKEFTLGFHPTPETGGVNWKIEDKNLVQSIIKYSSQVFIPTSDLKTIIDNGYRTRSEVEFKKQLIATWVSITIAFLVGLYSVLK